MAPNNALVRSSRMTRPGPHDPEPDRLDPQPPPTEEPEPQLGDPPHPPWPPPPITARPLRRIVLH